jgi:hypothetical protein
MRIGMDKMTTTDRLRHDIDRGATSDKMPFPDPAASPLGTDDEAGGTPPSHERIELARRQELHAGDPVGPGATDERERPMSGRVSPAWSRLIAIAFAILLVGAFAVAAFAAASTFAPG